jgi:hypothetical protein
MFEQLQKIADAVLLEGYVLYPYRASSAKNRYRWTFGVLAPRAWSEGGGCEPWWLEAQVIVDGLAPRVRGRLRFLRVVERRIEVAEADAFRPVDELEVEGCLHQSWEEGEPIELDFDISSSTRIATVPISLLEREEVETLRDRGGSVAGRVVRVHRALRGALVLRSERLPSSGAEALTRVSVRVENRTPFPVEEAPRAVAIRASCVSTHVILGVHGGTFLSLLDPPSSAVEASAACKNVGTYPVLAGDAERSDFMLCAPIILGDHPAVAPESPGDFFDGGEIDELLALRTRTLTPDEKKLARAADARTAELVDRAEALDEEAMARLHGAIRQRAPSPPPGDVDRAFQPGARVRLRPNATRRTDAQDLLYAGYAARVEAVHEDVDGTQYLAVTIDGDPAAELHRWYGRFHYYRTDEVEPIEEDA